jgi:putative ABC transport system permease protein
VTGIGQDLRFACRSLRSKPGYAAAVIVLMALGIGATTAAFSAVNGILWIRFPYPDAGRLVVPVSVSTSQGIGRSNIIYADYRDWRDMKDVFDRVALSTTGEVDLTGTGDPETIGVAQVSEEYFATLGLRPTLGRAFRPENHVPGAPVVAVLSHGLWQRRFGGARDCIGRTVRLSGRPVEIVGVMPPSANYQTTTLLWVPVQANPADPDNARRDNMVWNSVARLAPGVPLDQARTRVKELAARLERDQPGIRRGWTNDLIPIRQAAIPESARRATIVLFGAVVALLLVACVNVAGLLLARVTTRQREIAVRMALGASRGRIVAQVLTESLLLAVAGGGVGVLLARAGLAVVPSLVPADILPPDGVDLSVNGLVLAFAVGVACTSPLLFGFLPAWVATSARAEESLRTTTGAIVQRRTQRLRSALVTAEIAMSLALLVGAGLLIKSFARLQSADTGVRTGHLLTAGLRAPQGRYAPGAPVRDFYARILERVQAIPGVTSAAAVSLVPVGGPGFQLGRAFLPQGAPEPPVGPDYGGEWSVVTPSYFGTMKIPIVKGRAFTDRDTEEWTPVTIISETMARRIFQDRDAIGQRIRSWRDENVLREIVGVARDVRYFGAGSAWQALVYVPHTQSTWRGMRLVIRTAGDPLAIASALRRALASVDRDVPLAEGSTVDQYRLASMAGPRLAATLLGGFGVVALVLAAVGVLGLMSYTVAVRTREFGLRLALGARPRDVIGLVVGRGAVLTAIGLAAGTAGAYALSRTLESLLFEVTATDGMTFVSMPAVLAATAMVASAIPACRAVRIDPAATLRAE